MVVKKTILCEKYSLSGDCPYGAKCMFAHGSSDYNIRVPLCEDTNCQLGDMCKNRHEGKCVNKTKLCKNFLNGECLFGDKCAYAHGSTDYNMKVVPLCEYADRCTLGNKCKLRHLAEWDNTVKKDNHKTAICKAWLAGNCEHEDPESGNAVDCCFAHGAKDFGETHPICGEGEKCLYGDDCRFRHLIFWPSENKVVRTRMCQSTLTNRICHNPNCSYAHGSKDYNDSVPLCQAYQNGYCSFGDYCRFSHKYPNFFEFDTTFSIDEIDDYVNVIM